MECILLTVNLDLALPFISSVKNKFIQEICKIYIHTVITHVHKYIKNIQKYSLKTFNSRKRTIIQNNLM